MFLLKILLICSIIWSNYTTSSEDLPDFYTYTVKDIKGNEISLEQYRGKVSLVVNVASACGYTDTHYKALKRLHDILSFSGKFNVLAFPCNQFGEQEPLENSVIEQFAINQYGVEFPMFSKVDVVGEDADAAFKNLIDQSYVQPEWNFYKYLVDHNGHVLKTWGTKVPIEDIFDEVEEAVKKAEKLNLKTEPEDIKKDEL